MEIKASMLPYCAISKKVVVQYLHFKVFFFYDLLVIRGIFSVFQLFLAHCSGWGLEVGSVELHFLALRGGDLSMLTFHLSPHIKILKNSGCTGKRRK